MLRNWNALRAGRFATASLAFWISGAALAQDATVYSEQGQLIRASRNVTSLGADLMGDKVNLYTGSVEFSQTEVSLPGNNALPVSVGRRYVTGVQRQNFYEGLFVDWDLEIPHLHGTYAYGSAAIQGWVNFSTATRNQRCTNFGPPPEATTPAHAILEPDQFWGGHFLYVPGQGDQKLLKRDAANTTQPPGSYPVVTKSNWQFSCITGLASPLTAAGTDPTGEGFIALSPDGTQYRFDWMVSRLYQGVSNSTGGTSRQEVWILPTVITDRFGNTVTYSYDRTDPWKLKTISSSDGRVITLTYATGHRVSSIYDGTRRWTYGYNNSTAGTQGSRLTSVTLPDSSSWAFNLNEQAGAPTVSPTNRCSGSTYSDGTLTPSPTSNTITHPSGAVGTFVMSFVMHGRSGTSSVATNPCPGFTSDQGTPAFGIRSLTSKTISGPGIPGLTWVYGWGPANGSFYCTGSCPTTKTLTVTDPRTYQTRYTFSNHYLIDEGQLLQTDEGWDGTNALRTTVSQYAGATPTPSYPLTSGNSGSDSGDDLTETRNYPLIARTITQQGVKFKWLVNSFDSTVTFPRVTSVTRSSASVSGTLRDSKTDTTVFDDNATKWIMGQVKTQSTNGIETAKTLHDPSSALPTSTYLFGKLQANYTFNTIPGTPNTGTLSTVQDGRGNVTTYSDYWRGLARNILYADGTSQSAVVENIGVIDSVTNEAHNTWSYGYDLMGRLNLVTPPAEVGVTFNPTTILLEQVGTENGIAGTHWRQTTKTGTAVTVNHFDALLRRLISTTSDSLSPTTTTKSQLFTYDADSRVLSQSYATYPAITNILASLPGTSTIYDPLGRPITRTSNLDASATAVTGIAYLTDFTRQTTDPKLNVSTAQFQAFDQPTESALTQLAAPQGLNLTIARDAFGKTTSMTKYGTNAGVATSVTRSYVYDGYQLLCKTIEPELGATLQDWDASGNLAWRTGGTSLTSASCDRASVAPAQTMTFAYDLRNRLTTTTYGDQSPSVARTYTNDGLPFQTSTKDGVSLQPISVWTSAYFNGGLVKSETLSLAGSSYTIGRTYDLNGNLATLSYPDAAGTSVSFSTDALGQTTAVARTGQTYASGVTHLPNGAIGSFTYGNGSIHSLTEHVNGLPWVMTDSSLVQDKYEYDSNNNVSSITDQTSQGLATRTMSYDGLDRLITANGIWGSGSYSYDVQDNIRASTVGARAATHVYNANNQLTSVSGTGVNLTYTYDANGNVRTRAAQTFTFDLGNRLTGAPGQSAYTYDGFGRRTMIANVDGSAELQIYSPSTGQFIFAANLQTNAATQIFSCPAGQTLSGSSCLATSTVPATVTGYSCPAGYTLSGSTCSQGTTTTVAATISGYSCPTGYTLSGSTCSQTTSSTSAATPTYSCPSGQTLSGTSCIATSSAAATPVYSCPGGYSLSGTNCNGSTTAAATATPSCNGHGTLTTSSISSTGTYCLLQNFSYKANPDPDQSCLALAGTDGLVMDPNSAGPGGVNYRCILTPHITYSCPSGGTLSGTSCVTSVTVAATISSYTCSSGTLSGSSCITTTTGAASVSYSCPAGQSLSGSTCTLTTTATTAGTPIYSCPTNYSLSGSTCTLTGTNTTPGTPIYACTGSAVLSGSSCVTTTSTTATSTYSCPGGGTLSGSVCDGGTGVAPSSWTKYIYLDGKVIAEDDTVGGVTFAYSDALGSPVARSSSSGTLLTRFEPYGNIASGFNPTRPNSIGFTGHVSDANTGLTYMQQRYYDPIAARFLSVDPVVNTDKNFSRYSYALNNPFRNTDPDGRQATSNAGDACFWTVTCSSSVIYPSSGGKTEKAEDSSGSSLDNVQLAQDTVSITTAIRQAILTGNRAALEDLLGAGGLNPQQEAMVTRALYRMELKGAKIAEEAAKKGFDRLVKDPPFRSHGEKVFTDGKNFLTRDLDVHSGGVWKLFNRAGDRIGTLDENLIKIAE